MERQIRIGNTTMTPSEIWERWVGAQSAAEFARSYPDFDAAGVVDMYLLEPVGPVYAKKPAWDGTIYYQPVWQAAATELGTTADDLFTGVREGLIGFLQAQDHA